MPRWLPLLLGFLTAVGPLSTDMYLPAFPAIEAELGRGWGGVQATLSAWFLGLAVGQLVQGTLADRFGRRRPLVIGTVVYTIASIGCAMASDMAMLSLCRCIAGLRRRRQRRDTARHGPRPRHRPRRRPVDVAADAGDGRGADPGAEHRRIAAGGRGMARHLLADRRLRRRLMPTCLAPAAGDAATGAPAAPFRHGAAGGFRPHRDGARLPGQCGDGWRPPCSWSSPSSAARRRSISSSTASRRRASACCSRSAPSASSARRSSNPWLLGRFGDRVPRFALLLSLASVLLLVGSAFTGIGGFLGLYLPACLALACTGLVMPNAAVGALARHAKRAGSASALLGTLQFGLAALGAALVGALTAGTAQPMAVLMLLGIGTAVLAELGRPRR
jgi:DHA1 family bicyclomycin/chloramphenicol resistance-like MFS transporter